MFIIARERLKTPQTVFLKHSHAETETHFQTRLGI